MWWQTLLYYLNEPWDEAADGGALRIHVPTACAPAVADGAWPSGHTAAVDVHPHRDTLAVFRADRVMHEVRPCTGRHRYAASVWVTCAGVAARRTGRKRRAQTDT